MKTGQQKDLRLAEAWDTKHQAETGWERAKRPGLAEITRKQDWKFSCIWWAEVGQQRQPKMRAFYRLCKRPEDPTPESSQQFRWLVLRVSYGPGISVCLHAGMWWGGDKVSGCGTQGLRLQVPVTESVVLAQHKYENQERNLFLFKDDESSKHRNRLEIRVWRKTAIQQTKKKI